MLDFLKSYEVKLKCKLELQSFVLDFASTNLLYFKYNMLKSI